MKLVVVSTGNDSPHRGACLRSVRRAMLHLPPEVDVRHVYEDASLQAVPKCQLENMRDAISELDPWDIVCSLDGDDELFSEDALLHVWKLYHATDDLWLTYGNFLRVTPQGNYESHLRAYPRGADIRRHPWLASHLKTFRAGLFQRIRPESFQFEEDGQNGRKIGWIDLVTDIAMMCPMVEMSGWDRTTFVRKLLVNYHEVGDWTDRYDVTRARAIEKHIRESKPYERLRTL